MSALADAGDDLCVLPMMDGNSPGSPVTPLIVDKQTGTVTSSTVPITCTASVAAAPDGGCWYVGVVPGGNCGAPIRRLRLEPGNSTPTIVSDGGPLPGRLHVDPRGGSVWHASQGSSNLERLDAGLGVDELYTGLSIRDFDLRKLCDDVGDAGCVEVWYVPGSAPKLFRSIPDPSVPLDGTLVIQEEYRLGVGRPIRMSFVP